MDTLHRTPSGILGELSSSERSVEERLRTLAMCTCALGVVGASLYWLRTVLVPFVLANALQQMLVPLVELLVMIRICGCFHMPRFIAVLITIFVAAAFLSGIGLVVHQRGRDIYQARVIVKARSKKFEFNGVYHSYASASWLDLVTEKDRWSGISTGLIWLARVGFIRHAIDETPERNKGKFKAFPKTLKIR